MATRESCSGPFLLCACVGTDPGSPEARSKLITQLTTTMWATTIPIGFAGYGISWLRLHWFTDTVLPKFK